MFTQLNSAKHHLTMNVSVYQITVYDEAPREAPARQHRGGGAWRGAGQGAEKSRGTRNGRRPDTELQVASNDLSSFRAFALSHFRIFAFSRFNSAGRKQGWNVKTRKNESTKGVRDRMQMMPVKNLIGTEKQSRQRTIISSLPCIFLSHFSFQHASRRCALTAASCTCENFSAPSPTTCYWRIAMNAAHNPLSGKDLRHGHFAYHRPKTREAVRKSAVWLES
jgi:hypothetical protein